MGNYCVLSAQSSHVQCNRTKRNPYFPTYHISGVHIRVHLLHHVGHHLSIALASCLMEGSLAHLVKW